MTPNGARGWLATLMPLAERAGPVLSVFLLVLGTLTVWYMLGVLDRSVQRNHQLVERLQGCMKEQVELVLKLREHQP